MNFASIWANARWRLSCSDTGERATRRRAERATAMVMKVRSTPSSIRPRFEERPIIVKRVPAGSRAKRQTNPVIKKGPKRRNDAANQTIARSVKAIQNRQNRQNFPDIQPPNHETDGRTDACHDPRCTVDPVVVGTAGRLRRSKSLSTRPRATSS